MEWPLLYEVSDHELRLELARRSDEDAGKPRQVGSYRSRSETGSQSLNGTAGAPGPSTPDLAQMAQARIDVWCTREDGSNTFQGRLQGISSRLNEGLEEGYILTVYFDYQTSRRLNERLSGLRGKYGTVAAGSLVTIEIEEPPST